jgi:hypothetical protein
MIIGTIAKQAEKKLQSIYGYSWQDFAQSCLKIFSCTSLPEWVME